MPIRQIWQSTTENGQPPRPFEDWLSSLSDVEQATYQAAKQRQHAYRQQAIDRGDMIIDNAGAYIWRDPETAKHGKPQDDVWAKYHARYHFECGIKTICIEEETQC